MPRVYKPRPGGKRYKKYDDLVMKQALDELTLNRNATIRSVAEKFNISRSVLQRHSTRQMKSLGGQTALSKEEEDHIVLNLNTCAEWGYPLDITDLRFLVKSYLDMLGIKHKRFKDNLPGRDFVYGFLERHKKSISQRLCQNIKRARAAVSPTTINMYFSELEKSIENVPLSNILNYDETNLSDDPGRHKILTRRGCKYPERIVNHSKASVSLMIAATADGELLPPYVVYKSTNLYDTWVKNGPEHARYNRTSSGWFDAEVFKDWVKEIVIPFFEKKQGKKVLVGDNLSSHLSIDLIRLCKSHDIEFVFLPANSTHLTQPLDVAFFRPMKIAWRQILQKWKKTDGRSLSSVPKGCFPRMLKMLMDQIKINSENNILAGFRKTGISPLNRNEVLARLPEENNENGETFTSAIDKSVLDLLKDMRYGSINITEPKNKRKIDVISGRSVSHEDIESYAETDTEPEIKKKQNQEITIIKTQTKNSSKVSLKGKGVGKRTKKTSDGKENKLPSPIAHCSNVLEPIIAKTNNLLTSENINEKESPYQEQSNDWRDVGKTPVVLPENLQLYEEKSSKVSLKGKGVGKRTKKTSDGKENKSPSPIAHCSNVLEPIIAKTNNLLTSENINEKESPYQKQHNDWRDIDVEKIPVILSEDLQLYEEIVIPYETKDLNENNVTKETDLIEIENKEASTSTDNAGEGSRRIKEENKNDATNKKINNTDGPKIIITRNTRITQAQLKQLLPKHQIKQTMRPVAINKKIEMPPMKKNYYGHSDEILEILESD